MKKSKCCNAQATLSRYQYICHCCSKPCDLVEENGIKTTKLYTKYLLVGEYGADTVEITAKVSDDKITLKTGYGRDFKFYNSDKEKAKKIINLMLEATKL